jgi:hypothetical protein
MSSPFITPPRLGGWTMSALIELADRRTERRGSKTLDLNSEFLMALQHLCMEKRWYWRRKTAMFQMTPSVWQYDLSAAAPGPNAADIQQFVKHGVRFYPAGIGASPWAELTPMFERDLQSAAMVSNAYYPIIKPPQQYFINPFMVLNVTPVPDQAYPTTLDYWACPSIVDSLGELIPLVPAFMHHVLLKRLEAQIFRYTMGEGAAKYQAAMGEYSSLIALYSGMDGMVPGEHIDWSADDDYESRFANAQSSVQSTT